MPRSRRALLVIVLAAGCSSSGPGQRTPDAVTSTARAPAIDHGAGLTRTADIAEPRASHTATLLADGTVLIAGGFRKGPDGRSQLYSSSAEIYDPTTRSFHATSPLVGARCGHTATVLADGKVLLAGGFDDAGVTPTAELYDPATASFTATGAMTIARGGFTATLLPRGDVLFIGGGDEDAAMPGSEVYHPGTGRFTTGPALRQGRVGHTATSLADGRVLVIGGSTRRATVTATAEVHVPGSAEFTAVGELSIPRYKHAATLLASGQVLVIGGSDERDWQGKYASAELFDPAAGAFVRTMGLRSERFKLANSVATLADGRVLIAGGSRELETFDVTSAVFMPAGQMDVANYYATTTALPGGGALIVGGYDDRVRTSSSAWLFAG